MMKAENDLQKVREEKERQAKESATIIERLKSDHRRQVRKHIIHLK